MAYSENNERFERGMEFLRSKNPTAAERLEGAFSDIAPDLMRYIAEFPFGDLYAREGLDMRLRQTATLSALATAGHMAQLKIHTGIALQIGFTTEELTEIFMQLAPYAGFPATINAVMALKEVIADTDIPLTNKGE